MASQTPSAPPKDFWQQFQNLVLVDPQGRAWLTATGRETLGRSLSEAACGSYKPLAWQDFRKLAARAGPYAQELGADLSLVRNLPPGSPERELLAQLLGAPHLAHASLPTAAVVSLVKWRGGKAA